MKRPALLLAAALAALAAGCASTDSLGRQSHRALVVEESGLDNVSFLYQPRPGDRRFPDPCRLEIYSGKAILRTGPSPQVRDSFSVATADRHWNGVAEGRLDLTGEQVREILQTFVDEGLVPERRPRAQGLPCLQYAGTIGREKFAAATSNAVLVDTFEDFVTSNFSGTLRQAALMH